MKSPFIIRFKDIDLSQLSVVGGKNASLGELTQQLGRLGINVPDGFAITVKGYQLFLKHNNLFDCRALH